MIGASGATKEFGGGDTTPPIGNIIKIKSVKNKVGAPFRETEVALMYDTGIDKIGDIFTMADRLGCFTKRGSWYDWVDSTGNVAILGNGSVAAKNTIRESKLIQDQLRAAIYNVLNPVDTKEAVVILPPVKEAKVAMPPKSPLTLNGKG
jgi:recombination protein RecA